MCGVTQNRWIVDLATLIVWSRKLSSALLEALGTAVDAGIIQSDQGTRLKAHFEENGLLPKRATQMRSELLSELAAPKDMDSLSSAEESEAPRFIRGFHDVLISIGIIIALTGLGMLASVYALIPAVIVLAEILVKRQRLALPAFVLTIAFVIGLVTAVVAALGNISATKPVEEMLIVYGAVAAGLIPFYWRYRVPVTLAALILSAILLCYCLTLLGMGNGTAFDFLISKEALWAAFGFSILAFCAAMWFDIRDRLRKTRYSDVAFWLHLGAAPALLNSALGLVLSTEKPGSVWMQSLTSSQAGASLAIIAVFMTIGLVIDRRAFVTAGLLSLGYALNAILKDMRLSLLDLGGDNLFGITALVVGIVVLALGIGWQPFRALVLSVLPVMVRDRVPPAAKA
jgi:hypothetical protein